MKFKRFSILPFQIPRRSFLTNLFLWLLRTFNQQFSQNFLRFINKPPHLHFRFKMLKTFYIIFIFIQIFIIFHPFKSLYSYLYYSIYETLKSSTHECENIFENYWRHLYCCYYLYDFHVWHLNRFCVRKKRDVIMTKYRYFFTTYNYNKNTSHHIRRLKAKSQDYEVDGKMWKSDYARILTKF